MVWHVTHDILWQCFFRFVVPVSVHDLWNKIIECIFLLLLAFMILTNSLWLELPLILLYWEVWFANFNPYCPLPPSEIALGNIRELSYIVFLMTITQVRLKLFACSNAFCPPKNGFELLLLEIFHPEGYTKLYLQSNWRGTRGVSLKLHSSASPDNRK